MMLIGFEDVGADRDVGLPSYLTRDARGRFSKSWALMRTLDDFKEAETAAANVSDDLNLSPNTISVQDCWNPVIAAALNDDVAKQFAMFMCKPSQKSSVPPLQVSTGTAYISAWAEQARIHVKGEKFQTTEDNVIEFTKKVESTLRLLRAFEQYDAKKHMDLYHQILSGKAKFDPEQKKFLGGMANEQVVLQFDPETKESYVSMKGFRIAGAKLAYLAGGSMLVSRILGHRPGTGTWKTYVGTDLTVVNTTALVCGDFKKVMQPFRDTVEAERLESKVPRASFEEIDAEFQRNPLVKQISDFASQNSLAPQQRFECESALRNIWRTVKRSCDSKILKSLEETGDERSRAFHRKRVADTLQEYDQQISQKRLRQQTTSTNPLDALTQEADSDEDGEEEADSDENEGDEASSDEDEEEEKAGDTAANSDEVDNGELTPNEFLPQLQDLIEGSGPMEPNGEDPGLQMLGDPLPTSASSKHIEYAR
ncbi:hypothetical protein HDU96_000914 [Phlyctochytrium bullatum]|nr:hypothetical protein HDU96_000914 [Phlyctochytrium bullatum]